MNTIFPAVVIAFLTLISALPWGLPPEIRFVLPLLPLVAIHYWIVRGTARIAEWFVFLAGLTLDVLTNGPLGYWSIMYLGGHALSTMLAPRARALRFGGWASLMVVTAALSVVIFAVTSLYAFEIADWRPLVIAAFAAASAYPVLAGLLSLFEDRPRAEGGAAASSAGGGG